MTQEHRDYLTALVWSGATDKWGVIPFLREKFNLTYKEAGDILGEIVMDKNFGVNNEQT
jgi:hypothetical protein